MVGRKRRQMASRAMHSVTKVRVMTVVIAVVRRSSQSLTLNLSSSLGQHGNVTAAIVVNRRNRQSKGRVGVGGRHIR